MMLHEKIGLGLLFGSLLIAIINLEEFSYLGSIIVFTLGLFILFWEETGPKGKRRKGK